MGESITVTGMVLAAMPVGEYDKRLVILTRERGRIAAFARGARRMNSPFLAGSRPFSFGEFTLYEGRSSYTVSSVSIHNYFAELSQDYMGAVYGFYFMELAEYYTRENTDESQMLKLLYQSFRALCNEKLPDELVKLVFELKTLTINGEYPQMSACVECGSTEGLQTLDVQRGGILCRECQGDRGQHLSEPAVYAMQYIISSPIGKLYTFTVSDSVLAELKEAVGSFMHRYMDRSMKSLEILESMY